MQSSGDREASGDDFGESIIRTFLMENQEQVRAIDEEIHELMGRLLATLCLCINEKVASLQNEATENKQERQQLQKQLEALSNRLQVAETENIELRGELQEFLGEVTQRQTEYQDELDQSKYELETSQRNIHLLQSQRRQWEQIFREYEIKIQEEAQQKLFLSKALNREQGKRRSLEAQLREVQGQLVQLSWQFQSLERSHDELSQSLESKDERLRHLNRIIEESEYLSSLSPHSHQCIVDADIHQESNSYTSQKLRKTLVQEEVPLIRLSQSQLPVDQSLQSISAVSIEEDRQPPLLSVPKSQRVMVASESKLKKYSKVILSHQKKPSKQDLSERKDPEKSKTIKQDTKTIALSKQSSQLVKSKLTSIFRDRLKYKSENDQKHEHKVNQLRSRLQERQQEISSLHRQISMLKVVKAEPVIVSSGSKEGKREILHLRTENDALRRISKQISLRKQHIEAELEEYKERCHYYKAEHRKIYEQYLLKNAESVAYSQQLQQMEMSMMREGREDRPEQDMLLQYKAEEHMIQEEERNISGYKQQHKDQFQDLSLKFNNLVLRHNHAGLNELQEPSFKSGEDAQRKDFYSIQNIHLSDNSATERTLEHERRIPQKHSDSYQNSPAKAVFNENFTPEELLLEGIQQISHKKQNPNQGEIQTERLILSELQTSRRQSSFTGFQLIFSQHPVKMLKAEMVITPIESITIVAHPRCVLGIMTFQSITVFPIKKQSNGVSHQIQSQNQQAQTTAILYVDSSIGETFQMKNFSSMFSPSQLHASTQTDAIFSSESSTNTSMITTKHIQAQCISIQTYECSSNTQQVKIFQSSMNTESVCYQQISIQTNMTQSAEASISTDKTEIIEQLIGTDMIQLSEAETQTFKPNLCLTSQNITHQIIQKANLGLFSQIFGIQIHQSSQKIDQGTDPITKLYLNQSTNTQSRTLKDAQTICNPKILQISQQKNSQTVHPTVRLSNISIFSQTVKENIDKPINKLQLDLSFLSNDKPADQLNKMTVEFDEQGSVPQKHLRAKSDINLLMAQINSGRTRSSSQELNSNRSDKLNDKSQQRVPIRESMISEHSSGSSQEQNLKRLVRCDDSSKIITENNTTSHTPFTDKQSMMTSRVMAETQMDKLVQKLSEKEESEKTDVEAYSEQELQVIKDYLYNLQQFQLSFMVETTDKSYLPSYDLKNNMYIIHASRESRLEKFVCWGGKIIHFGKGIQFMELTGLSKYERLVGNNVILGNCEFRIFKNKLQIYRSLKKRCFKGEMEDGEWVVERAWVFKTN